PISSGQALGRGVSALNGKVIDSLGGRAEAVADLSAAPALQGKHNAQNAAAAFAATSALGVDHRIIAQAMTMFAGLPHRLERAGQIEGVRFINDSKATNANAAAQALAVYPRVYWIAGGVAKEGGIEDLDPFFPRMAKAYLIGQSAGDFSDTLRGKVAVAMSGNLEAAVKMAFADAKASGEPHPVVLLSPACASFDQFKSYEDRGDQFKKFVAALGDGANGKRNGGAA
ncbi:MAG: UDP-N-acetylmuramoyl-L-alanine--D-glutamate ligase, partial [Hyphomonadaceae bacterium]|nr:UDP-N-acetylmuramoyl-L-alanine--D-glutamate ligase [Hyphomonadaceae bacterium]